ncbi:Protein kinase, putative [Hondaea fermentalgiana]|uniref:Protein kinase, putative n=1 Tax=Hondaea fermentalgiana TaxID=2315210 RepID=A0A2R5GK63_9STRA|nr:Protein kinase, putative [Hondaea fermentalgiana]|eukprot:GBG31270.1 Protein kinase, putative [Hondaea fermentalgiana]
MSLQLVVDGVLDMIKIVRTRIENVMVLKSQMTSLNEILSIMEQVLSQHVGVELNGLNELESLVGEIGSALDVLHSDSNDRLVVKFIAFWNSEAAKRKLQKLMTRIVSVFLGIAAAIEPWQIETLEDLVSEEQMLRDDRSDRAQLNEELPLLLDGLEEQIDESQFEFLKEALAEARERNEFFLSDESVKFAMANIVHILQTQGDEAEMANLSGEELLVNMDNELGRGGFGVVFLGRYHDQPCAVKMIDIGADVVSDAARSNMRNEIKIWRELKHPNIVEFYGAAIVDHRMLMALELCDTSLGEVIHKQHVNFAKDFDAYCAIARGICRAVAHLHSNFIIHRDIKPSNVMVSSNLRMVKLTDFGMSLAKEEIYGKAITSTIRGTPVYMAPEVCFPPAHWTFRADVYALAILLWEMFNGVQPFEDESNSLHIMQRVAMNNERPPLNEDMPHWLWSIMESAWDPIPEQRPSASMLLTKIDKHSKDGSRSSMRAIGNLLSKLRRRPGGSILNRTVPTRMSGAESVRTQREFNPIGNASGRSLARAGRGQNRAGSYVRADSVGRGSFFSNRSSAAQNLDQAPADEEDDEEDILVADVVERGNHLGVVPFAAEVTESSEEGVSARARGESSGSMGSASMAIKYGANADNRGNLIAVGGMSGLELWDARKGKRIKTLSGHTGAVFAIAFSSDGGLLVSGSSDKTIRVWETSKFRLKTTLRGHKDAVNCVAISNNSNIVVSGSGDKTIKVWNLLNSEVVFSFSGHTDAVSEVQFTPDESNLVSSSQDGTIRVWSVHDTGLLSTVPTDKPIKSLALSPDGSQAVVAQEGKVLKVFSMSTFECTSELRAHSTSLNFVAWSHGPGNYFASASRGGSIRVWSADSLTQVRQLSGHTSRCDFVDFSAKGGYVISCSRDHTTRIWSVSSGKNIKILQHETVPLCASFSPFFLY